MIIPAPAPDKTAYDFGKVKTGNQYRAVFTIKNTGNNPLVIQRVSTSCGCTVADWEQCPISPSQATDITVEMNPEEPGYFRKTIDVYCNIEQFPLKLTISGMTEE